MSRPAGILVLCASALLWACAGKPGGPAAPQPAPRAQKSLAPAVVIPEERRASLEADLAAAEAAYDANPHSEDAAIWLGRRLAYLGRFDEAIEIFGRGIAEHPESHQLLRHRGHRYITTRQFDLAIADLTRATQLIRGVRDEVEPDGAPNSLNKPRSTGHSNIWYHLGLAHYLKGDYESALAAYRRCMDYSWTNDDMLVATSQWLYLTLRRLGRDREAAAVLQPIRPRMDVIENGAYHRLLRMAKGELTPDEVLAAPCDGPIDDATTGYGVGASFWVNGEPDRARAVWERVLRGDAAASFGYIAAEAEMRRDTEAEHAHGQ